MSRGERSCGLLIRGVSAFLQTKFTIKRDRLVSGLEGGTVGHLIADAAHDIDARL